jgi:hypothetical protein
MRALYWPLFALLIAAAVAHSAGQKDGLRRARSDNHLREPIGAHTAPHPTKAASIRDARYSCGSLDRPAAVWLTGRSVRNRQMVLGTVPDHRELLAPWHDARAVSRPLGKPMAIGHLIITFDQKRPSAAFVWPDTGAAMKVAYVETVDGVMHLASPDQGRIMLPLGEIVEPIPGVRMKFYEPSRPRVRIEAPKSVRIVR